MLSIINYQENASQNHSELQPHNPQDYYSVTKSRLTLCDTMDCSMPGLNWPSLSPEVCSDSCPLSQWCHPTILSSVAPFLLLPSIFPSIRVFSSELTLHQVALRISFSVSPSNEYSGLISFRTDSFDLFAVQGTLESSPQFEKSILWCSAFFMVHVLGHDNWKNHSLDYMDLCWQSDVCLLPVGWLQSKWQKLARI